MTTLGPMRIPSLLAITILSAVGCGTADRSSTARATELADDSLTPELARRIISDAPAFHIEESTVHVLEWQMDSGEQAGLWAIRRTPENGKTRVTVEILQAANWLESAEYFSGGIVPMHLREPISRHVVDIVEMADAEFPQMKEVRFTWAYSDSPSILHGLKPELTGGPYPARVRLQFQEDAWKVVGHVRDSRIEL